MIVLKIVMSKHYEINYKKL